METGTDMMRISYLSLDGVNRVVAEWSQNPIGHLNIYEDTGEGRKGTKITDRMMGYDQFNFWRATILQDSDAQAYEVTVSD